MIKNGFLKCQTKGYARNFFSSGTIYALSSGWGKCGVSVIRLSGLKSCHIIQTLTHNLITPEPRRAILTKIFCPLNKEIIDKCIMLWFPGPNSFTGEDSCEFHIHGSIAVQKALFKAFEHFEGVRLAEPGEFVKRAFYNGKLDLTEVEGLSDLIKAETEQQRKAAIRMLDGELKSLYTKWRHIIIKAQANIEMLIDFSEAHQIDYEHGGPNQIKLSIDELYLDISKFIHNSETRGDRLANGFHITFLGSPNVGKSSLFNKITQAENAIVSAVPGTTRDILKITCDLGGYPVIYTDTAGIRNIKSNNTLCQDEIESEGIKRAKASIVKSDIIVLMIDATYIAAQLPILLELDNAAFIHSNFNQLCSKNIQTLYALWEKLLTDYIEITLGIQPHTIFGQNSEYFKGSGDNLNTRNYIHLLDPLKVNHNKFSGDKEPALVRSLEKKIICIINKSDIINSQTIKNYEQIDTFLRLSTKHFTNLLPISCKDNHNIDFFTTKLIDALAQICGDLSKEHPLIHSQRQKNHLQVCLKYLREFRDLPFAEINYVVLARNLQRAARNLSLITVGMTDTDYSAYANNPNDPDGPLPLYLPIGTEDILDSIFKDFCIGK